jgi:death on curing protein
VTIFLSAEQVLFIHHRIIEETGGSHGLRDLALLLSAIGRPYSTFDGKNLYPDLFAQAAALMDSLIHNHPFLDGNKRTSITAASLFIFLNGYTLKVSHAEMVRFTLKCTQSKVSIEQMAKWFKLYCVPNSFN